MDGDQLSQSSDTDTSSFIESEVAGTDSDLDVQDYDIDIDFDSDCDCDYSPSQEVEDIYESLLNSVDSPEEDHFANLEEFLKCFDGQTDISNSFGDEDDKVDRNERIIITLDANCDNEIQGNLENVSFDKEMEKKSTVEMKIEEDDQTIVLPSTVDGEVQIESIRNVNDEKPGRLEKEWKKPIRKLRPRANIYWNESSLSYLKAQENIFSHYASLKRKR